MNILIIEDENKTAEYLKELIECNTEHLIVNICQSITKSVNYLKRNQQKLDLIFMDIQLADGNSFEIFKQIEVTKPVIFCTAYDNYMLQAFKNNGIYYILKPFKLEDINAALSKIRAMQKSLIQNQNKMTGIFDNNYLQTKQFQISFLVQNREKMIPLDVDKIAFIHLKNEIVYVFKFSGEKSSIFKTLDEIERAIDPKQFFRINRQMIVNRKAIKEIVPFFNRKVEVNLNIPITLDIIVSRQKVTPLKEWLEKPE